jgi:isovaleryl-CoA dehydrogenase
MAPTGSSPHPDSIASLQAPTEEHRMLRELVAGFVADEVEPQAAAHDRAGTLNGDLMRKAGELGLLGLTVPAGDGGAGLDATAAVIAHHEIAKSDPGFALAYLAHAILFVNNFLHAASPEQRARYLARTLTGEWIGAMGMTEPGAGTDVLGMQTTATRRGDDYVLRGRKTFITNAPDATCFLVYAKVDGEVTAFVVDRTCSGFATGPHIEKMGMRAAPMGELLFDDCVVPVANRLGAEGGGAVHMMRNLEIERLCLAAMSLGIADRCIDIMLRYSVERHAFGKPIAEFGQIQRYVAESYAKTEAARCLIYQVARDVGPDRRNRIATDAAKLFAAPVGKEVADNAMQVLGGWGYCTEFVVERLLRDAKLLEIGGGTLESHQKNLTRDLTRHLGS